MTRAFVVALVLLSLSSLIASQRLAAYYSSRALLKQNFVADAVKALVVPKPLEVGISRTLGCSLAFSDASIVRFNYVPTHSDVQLNDQNKTARITSGHVQAAIRFTWSKYVSLVPFVELSSGKATMIIKSRVISLEDTFSIVSGGLKIKSDLSTEFTRIRNSSVIFEVAQEEDVDWLYERTEESFLDVLPQISKYVNEYLNIHLNLANNRLEGAIQNNLTYAYRNSDPLKIDLNIDRIALNKGLTLFFHGGVEGETQVEPSQFDEFNPRLGDIQFAINRRFFTRAIRYAQSKKMFTITLDSNNYWAKNLNFAIGDFFVEFPGLRQRFYGDQKYGITCDANDANGFLNVTLQEGSRFLTVQLAMKCNIDVVSSKENAFSFTFQPTFQVAPAVKSSLLYFKVQSTKAGPITGVDGVKLEQQSTGLLQKVLDSAAKGLRTADLWGSQFPAPNMFTVGFRVMSNSLVVYGRVPKDRTQPVKNVKK
eukprot:TRINITY_DN4700_c0_g1_i15.p1 TRINITY_DN4700_c0_g1~~TRINITY_DN4700_c0_g1_i15.p1  ORF type:complete len:481 (-),score=191.73 TRINITY_DN4700_c0_g1_i15:168-1610(-)